MAQGTQHPAPEAPPRPARVIIVEDDERLRSYAKGALAAARDIAVVGDAGTLADGLPLVDLMPDLALLDLGLPDGNGITVIEAIRTKVPACRVLVFTVFEDRASVLGTLKAGADGYILKDTSADMVLAHVRATLAGETPISARAATALLEQFGVPFEARVVSAHRTPDLLFTYAEQARARGLMRRRARGEALPPLAGTFHRSPS